MKPEFVYWMPREQNSEAKSERPVLGAHVSHCICDLSGGTVDRNPYPCIGNGCGFQRKNLSANKIAHETIGIVCCAYRQYDM